MGWETIRDKPDPRSDSELAELRDDDIIRRAELWATGATIHDVKGLIGMYRMATAVLDDPRAKGKKRRRLALETMVCALETLTDFMSHGNYRKARIDNPLPYSP